ncbi:MAG: isochorismate synthase [Clostridia bacterium]|nr:isochorismate synthase [Deltaproteobacteria bacterium]
MLNRTSAPFTLMAWGAIEMAHGEGATRFASALEHCSRVRELPMLGTAFSTPLWIGGAAFAPRRANATVATEAWVQWPDARFWIPRVMLITDAAGTRAVVSTWIRPADTKDSVLAAQQKMLNTELTAVLTRTIQIGQNQVASAAGRNAWNTLETEESWAARVDAASEAVRRGEIDKVVTARAVRLRVPRGTRIDIARTVASLAERHPASTCFAIGNDDGSVFVGATPETLLTVRDGWIETHALAGTAPRGASEHEDEMLAVALIASAKNREEHDVVAHALRKELAGHCSVIEAAAPEPHLVKLARVQHLETTMRGKLANPVHILALASTLHPTPAVGGFPAAAAMHYLEAHEPLDRGWYAGPVGFVDAAGEGTLVVGIRSMVLRPDAAWAFAGGGIVAASNGRDEWRETELKLAGITETVVESYESINEGAMAAL